jgi:hypothetical protein
MSSNALKEISSKDISQHTEVVHPLAQAVDAYEQVVTDISETKKHIQRCESDEQKALDEGTGIDIEHRISESRRMRGIYASRLTHKESARERLKSELESALSTAHQQHTELLMSVWKSRRDILAERIQEIAQSSPLPMGLIDEILSYSKPITAVQQLDIPLGMLSGQDVVQTIATARRILASLKKLEDLKNEGI